MIFAVLLFVVVIGAVVWAVRWLVTTLTAIRDNTARTADLLARSERSTHSRS